VTATKKGGHKPSHRRRNVPTDGAEREAAIGRVVERLLFAAVAIRRMIRGATCLPANEQAK